MADSGEFQRRFFETDQRWTWIGTGGIGGKAAGLVAADEILADTFDAEQFSGVTVSIPTFTVIRTDIFTAFLERNSLTDVVSSDAPDDVIAQEFQKAALPAEILGDLRALIAEVRTPLAVRSSSLLEDSLHQPFAGIYTTKMLPNNQPGVDERFRKLMEAIKLVYASVFFKSARDYLRAVGRSVREEKMAVVIQEVVGRRVNSEFYPQISGVARSFNYYPVGGALREEGVVDLALGLGKTIVDGGLCWTYSPRHPANPPPFASAEAYLDLTQSEFWAVNMGKLPAYDPIRETEYLSRLTLADAENHGSLDLIASTFDPDSLRIVPGTLRSGPRVLTFSGLLQTTGQPFNDVICTLLDVFRSEMAGAVEIEFAATLNPDRIGFLQVRPMAVEGETVKLEEGDLEEEGVVIASDRVLGNGVVNTISDIIYVKPEKFDAAYTQKIAEELESFNRGLLDKGRPYLLIGFGRWGSSDPWLGIPVNWGQVCGARVIVEAMLPTMNVELSQGSHFFHNLISFHVGYFNVSHGGRFHINWDWLSHRNASGESEFLRHIVMASPLDIRMDGRSGLGIISVSRGV